MAAPVNFQNPLQNIQNQNTNNIDPTTGQSTTGSGSVGQVNKLPDPVIVLAYAAILDTVQSLMPQMSNDDLDVLMSEVAEALKETTQATEKDKVNLDTQEKKAKLAEKKKELDEAAEKLKKAEEERNSGNIFTLIKLAFQALGALIMAAIGAALIATGVGAALGAVLVASAAFMLLAAVDGFTKVATGGMGIAGSIDYAINHDKESAAKADMGFGIAVAVCGVVCGVAQLFLGNPSALIGAVGALAKAALDTANLGVQALSIGADIGANVMRYKASEHSAEATKNNANAKDMEAFLQQIDDAIDQALSHMMASGDRFAAILEGIIDAMNDRGNSLTAAKFRG